MSLKDREEPAGLLISGKCSIFHKIASSSAGIVGCIYLSVCCVLSCFTVTCIAAVPGWGMLRMFKCKAVGKGT